MRAITHQFTAAGQLQPADMAAVRDAGFCHVINNRPDNEEPGQPTAEELAQAAADAGLPYTHLPMISGVLDPALISPTAAVLAQATGPVLAFCRSGARSTAMWALACAHSGADVDELCAQAQAAGYSLAAIRPHLVQVAAGR